MSQMKSKLDQTYGKVKTQTNVEIASPYRLIQMLMEGALEKVNFAKNYMINGNIAEKGAHISWAISIVSGLRVSLDAEKGGEIAQNLEALYDYIERRLLQANLENKVEYLDEIIGLLSEIKSGCDAIEDQVDSREQDNSQEMENVSTIGEISA